MRTLNKYIGIVLFVVSIAYITGGLLLPEYPHVPIDSNFLPLILGFLLLFLSIVLFFSKDPQNITLFVKKQDLMMLLGVALLIILYIFFLEILGFLIVTSLFLFTCSFLLGYRKHLTNAVVALFFPITIYYTFTQLLMISLPTGILPF
ncbi:tripartite tricarboxylate transporter TctB family protein [Alkalihalophilus marmarensis]|uniref:DUF1468 domain-containing protein n=1 Tax=Alkalihalophilus marmarensis DSM 21297 TaxID=1188261 RepID=U6SIT7_9BACI|nr:hypothetical protein A33I_20650 [Alkalihalophilus marmarensis DSM 21297]